MQDDATPPPAAARLSLWRAMFQRARERRALRRAQRAGKPEALARIKEDAARQFIAVLHLRRGGPEARAAYGAASALREATALAAPYAKVQEALGSYASALGDFLYAQDVRAVMQRRVTLNLYQTLADACDREAGRRG